MKKFARFVKKIIKFVTLKWWNLSTTTRNYAVTYYKVLEEVTWHLEPKTQKMTKIVKKLEKIVKISIIVKIVKIEMTKLSKNWKKASFIKNR